MKSVLNRIQTALLAIILLLAALGVNAESGPREIEIFTDENFPIAGIETLRKSGAQITVYDLGAPQRVARALGAGLPGDPEQAKAAMRAKVDAMGMDEIKRRFRAAYTGLVQALNYRIERYPAVVFDRGDAVIYGVTDLSEALRQYRDWRAGLNSAEHNE